jgi:hypothetical protein
MVGKIRGVGVIGDVGRPGLEEYVGGRCGLGCGRVIGQEHLVLEAALFLLVFCVDLDFC